MFFGATAQRDAHFQDSGPTSVSRARWKFSAGGLLIRNTVAVGDGMIFANFDNDRLYALDLAKGKEQWSQVFGSSTPESISNPIFHDGTVFVVGGGECLAIDASTGAVRWRFDCGRETTSSPIVDDGSVIVGTADGVAAINLSTGSEEWRYPAPDSSRVQCAISCARDVLAFGITSGAEDGQTVLLDRHTGEEKWRTKTGAMCHSGAAAISGDTVFVLGGLSRQVFALSLSTGAVRWSFQTANALWGSPAVAAGVVSFTGYHKTVHALDAATGQELWSRQLEGTAASISPAIADEIVYLGSGKLVQAWALHKGDEIWRWKAPKRVTTAPVIVDGRLYIGCDSVVVAL